MKLTKWLLFAVTRLLLVCFFFFRPSLFSLDRNDMPKWKNRESKASLGDRCARTDETTSMAFEGLDRRDL